MIDLIKRTWHGFQILSHSFSIFIRNQKLIIIHLIHTLALYITLNGLLLSFKSASIEIVSKDYILNHMSFGPVLLMIMAWLVLYFAYRIINQFFAVAIARSYIQTLKNNDESIIKSLKKVFSKILIIIKWATTWSYFSLYAASKPSNRSEATIKDGTQNAEAAVENILNFSWETTNLLVAPIIAEEEIKITTIAKHENNYFKEKFGENINVRFNFRFLDFLILISLAAYYVLFLSKLSNPSNSIIIAATAGLFSLYYIICLVPDLKTIFQSLVYGYINELPIKSKTIIEKTLILLKNK